MKFINEINLENKKVFIRADLNVPLDSDRKITDDNRIRQFLPTLRWVIEKGGKAIIASHLGRPADKPEAAFSLKPVAERLEKLLQMPVKVAPDCIGSEVKRLVEELQSGGVLLLENLRFHAAEKTNELAFSRELASYCDVFINDAFATAHRAHASIVGVPAHVSEKGAGLLVKKELEYFDKALVNPKSPLCVILGGAKVSTKLNAMINIASKADKLIIGGAMANTFLAAQGIQMGRSFYEAELFPRVLHLLATLARRDCKVYLPVDFIVGPSPSAKGLGRAVPVQEVPADMMALDIGPATSILYKEALHNAETIIWNGPMGAFENEDYAQGTTDMIGHVAGAHGLTIAGGGDTDAAIHQMELAHKFDFISTGGGAFLALLEGKSLPGFEALK
jgi:phosphoglycerate kinase